MFRPSVCLLICIAVLSFAPAAPVPTHLMPKKQPLYFPTTVGAEWVFAPGEEQSTCVVTAVLERAGEKVVSVGYVDRDGTILPVKHVRISGNGLHEVASPGDSPSPSICVLKLPLSIGDEWTYSDDVMQRRYKVRSRERVKVPAGTFLAVAVEVHHVCLRGGIQTSWTEWYAPDVGLIQTETRSGKTVLKSFTPGKD